eukprot:scaffold297_cov164-Ochromonas_danica.AAC.3
MSDISGSSKVFALLHTFIGHSKAVTSIKLHPVSEAELEHFYKLKYSSSSATQQQLQQGNGGGGIPKEEIDHQAVPLALPTDSPILGEGSNLHHDDIIIHKEVEDDENEHHVEDDEQHPIEEDTKFSLEGGKVIPKAEDRLNNPSYQPIVEDEKTGQVREDMGTCCTLIDIAPTNAVRAFKASLGGTTPRRRRSSMTFAGLQQDGEMDPSSKIDARGQTVPEYIESYLLFK